MKRVSNSMPDNFEDLKNYECPICIMILVEPIKVSCGHIYCRFCLDELILNSTDENEFKCPMCRSSIDKGLDFEIESFLDCCLKEKFPSEYNVRLKAVEDLRKLWGEYEKLRISYGNTHELVSEPRQSRSMLQYKNTHRWCTFVELDKEKSHLIDQVVFELHPTFNPNTVTITKPPFQISRLGWGMFEITIIIHWNKNFIDAEPLKLQHCLSFTGNGIRRMNITRIKLNKI